MGLPYFLLSSTGPLLQAWYAREHKGGMPYRLYSLSNAGSMFALLSYPVLFEPKLTTHQQTWTWSIAYSGFVLLCGFMAFRARNFTGLEAATGIMSVGALKPYSNDSKDPDIVAYREFMKARLPNVDPANLAAGYGYMVAQALVVVLQQCKNDLSRENIMAQAANLKGVSLPLLMPGVTLNTSPTDYRPIKDGYMVEFRDNQFNVVSELLRGS